ncbi:MAG: DEAD/DEAH box helicase [Chloroflexi bacterium]|nr:DEAD/DEAH box helicase [Chloroflexota bacterium]
MRFSELLSRADDETLQLLLGQAPLKLLLTLDPKLATPQQIRKLILRIYSAEGLLLSPDKRQILFDLLPNESASILHRVLQLPHNGNTNLELKLARFRRGSERERAMFDFFGLNVPVHEIHEQTPATNCSTGQYSLFDHQRAAVRNVTYALEEIPNRVMLHMPTGAGKTRVAMSVIADHLRKHEPTLVIWLANSEELCEQSASEFESAWNYLGNREIEVYRFWGNRELTLDEVYDGLLVGGLAKMYSATRKKLEFIMELAGRTSLVIIDEAHSAIAETYELILDALVRMPRPNPGLLGLTATPGRTWADIEIDEKLSEFFARRKVTLQIENYSNPVDYLVDEQYLAQVHYIPLYHDGQTELSDADVRNIQKNFDIPDSILMRLAEDELRNLAIITKLEELAKRHRRILVFAATVTHADVLAAVLQMKGYDAQSVTAKTPGILRSQIIEKFKQNTPEVRILCNFGVLTTGFDAPLTSAALIARPTKSLVLYSQMVGRTIRGLRVGGNLSAEIVTVIDYNLPGFESVAEAFNNWEDIWE